MIQKQDMSSQAHRPHRLVVSQHGMTMIEMIGVLGVIAVLAGLILPRVFEVIAESKVEALVTAVQTYETAITTYYKDVGTILPLDNQGIPQVENSGDSNQPLSLPARLTLSASDPLVNNNSLNLWPKFQGPYLRTFNSQFPPEIGTRMLLPAMQAIPLNSAVTPTNVGWDLKGDDGLSDLDTNANVVYFRLEGIGEEEFLKFDKMVDYLIGNTETERKLRGRAKWDPGQNGTMLYYVAHR